ncbi:hypothetical protein BCR34DRAFT_600804 [Clohesyomyces aquaticus]|uniref:Uncharacterized protein n=1 Tax=Clohesyomyces aquaticus TaxID=1231657 RepID=A0A1Y1ZPS0_9PLEO|nr:hypothetical protein BCR34DRAFT_600804 [Clohesyomyces aquaticus]
MPASRANRHAKTVSPKRIRKSVSVASVFKPRPRGAAKATPALKAIVTDAPVPAEKINRVKGSRKEDTSWSSSPVKREGHRALAKIEDVHPLDLAFKETTTNYRTTLLKNATADITATYGTLLSKLYESAQTDTEQSEPNGSPQPLSLSAKLQQSIAPLTYPIHNIKFRIRDDVYSFEDKMADFKIHITEHHAVLDALQTEWERTVGEIWKLGVQVLGESTMSSMFIPQPSPPRDGSSQEEGLFVPEDGDKGTTRVKAKKKVSFKEPLPSFLTMPSRYKRLAALPEIPKQEAKELEGTIENLGTTQMEELKRLEKGQQAFWKRKQQQIKLALQQE